MSILNINKKVEEQKRKEEEEKNKAFIVEYDALVIKHRRRIVAVMKYNLNGAFPTLAVVEDRKNEKKL